MLEYIDLLGKPFKFGGRGPDYYDCAGLMWELSKRLGYTPIDFNHIVESNARNDGLIDYFANYEMIQSIEQYSIILFNHECYNMVVHVGMAVDNYQFIHTTSKTNVIVDKLKEWTCRINSIYKLS